MKSDDFEAIVGILIGLFTIGVIMVPVGALWVYIILQNGKRKRIRERILAVHANLVGNKRWFPVRYASQPRFEAMLKILPWDTAGLLIVAPGGVLFLGENLAGDRGSANARGPTAPCRGFNFKRRIKNITLLRKPGS